MLKGENIKGYRILEDFKVAGGMSKISFAEKMARPISLKNFLPQNILHQTALEVNV